MKIIPIVAAAVIAGAAFCSPVPAHADEAPTAWDEEQVGIPNCDTREWDIQTLHYVGSDVVGESWRSEPIDSTELEFYCPALFPTRPAEDVVQVPVDYDGGNSSVDPQSDLDDSERDELGTWSGYLHQKVLL